MNLQKQLKILLQQCSEQILNKEEQIELSLLCFLAQGHLLIEDKPGVGKTTLAQSLAQLLGLRFERLQMTNDLMPSDIIGYKSLDLKTQNLYFSEGPIFTEILIADEFNRAPSKTQSALLQAMEEKKVSFEKQTYNLPDFFYIIATQNPSSHVGTQLLPESQTDRFMAAISLSYMKESAETQFFKTYNELKTNKLTTQLTPVLSREDLKLIQKSVNQVKLSEELASYVTQVLNTTRLRTTQFEALSTRAGLAWLQMAKARAFLCERSFVIPDDLQKTVRATLAHRLSELNPLSYGEKKVDELLELCPVPY